MTKYRIPSTWECFGYVYVDADSLDAAIERAYEERELPNGEYVDDSFLVDTGTVHLDYGTCNICGREVVVGDWAEPEGPMKGKRNFETDECLCRECQQPPTISWGLQATHA